MFRSRAKSESVLTFHIFSQQVDYEKVHYIWSAIKGYNYKQDQVMSGRNVITMFTSLRKRCRRSNSVNECDLEENSSYGQKSRFSMFSRKSSCDRDTGKYSTRRVHSEPTRRKFESGLQLSRSKNNSLKKKLDHNAIANNGSNRSLGGLDLDFASSNNQVSDGDSVRSQSESGLVSSPSTPRRLAICTELEKRTYMENGESLLIGHKNLVIRDFLESYAYI